jgi:hypothetical protein
LLLLTTFLFIAIFTFTLRVTLLFYNSSLHSYLHVWVSKFLPKLGKFLVTVSADLISILLSYFLLALIMFIFDCHSFLQTYCEYSYSHSFCDLVWIVSINLLKFLLFIFFKYILCFNSRIFTCLTFKIPTFLYFLKHAYLY